MKATARERKSARIAELRAVIEAEEISTANGATEQTDGNGLTVVDMAVCGTCKSAWNDALISARTPAPAGRCPYEYIHEEIAELRRLTGGLDDRDTHRRKRPRG